MQPPTHDLFPAGTTESWQSMSLQTIDSRRRPMLNRPSVPKEHRPRPLTDRPNLMAVADIDGAVPAQHTRTRNQERDYTVDCSDIPGCVSHRPISLQHLGRHVNPLAPDYALPRGEHILAPSELRTIPVPRFLGDRMSTTDIDGTSPSSSPYAARAVRDPLCVSDIDGTSTSLARHVRYNSVRDTLNVEDINQKRSRGERSRSSSPRTVRTETNNPLSPSYTIYGAVVADDPQATSPAAARGLRRGVQYAMTTVDIDGASPQWRPEWAPPVGRQCHDPNDASDIAGARTRGELHKGMTSRRRVDPLDARYIGLDGKSSAR